MHLRPKPWARPELEASPIFCAEPWTLRGRWPAFFEKTQPLYLELGCGKGGFIAQMAAAHPENNYLALDMIDAVLGLSRRQIVAAAGREDPGNIRLTAWDIERIDAILAPEDRISGLFINFCNPWPRHRQHKKRLTHPRQLEKYKAFLLPEAMIRFKTDDRGLFDDSLRYFSDTGFQVQTVIRDLAAQPVPGDFPTEHERMFEEQGLPIYYAAAQLGEN